MNKHVFIIEQGMTEEAILYNLSVHNERCREESFNIAEELRERFDSIDIKAEPIEALILLDHMMRHSSFTTGEPIVAPSVVEERLAEAGILLPKEIAWECQPHIGDADIRDQILRPDYDPKVLQAQLNESSAENERFNRDSKVYIDRISQLMKKGDFATCLSTALQAALVNYMFLAYHEIGYLASDFFLDPLIENFPKETEALSRYMQLHNT